MIHNNPITVNGTKVSVGRVSTHALLVFFAILMAASTSPLLVNAAPQQPARPAAAQSRPKQTYRLRITGGHIVGVSLKANKTKMTEIAAALSKRLSAQVVLGQSVSKEAITVEFADLPLETAMALLAPRVFIDYEIKANAPPAPLGIFLLGQEDPEPAKNATVKSSSQALMFEGNTEDEPAQPDPDADPLQVDLDDNFLTIKSKKQLLIAVVLTIAEVLEVPAEIRYESTEMVDVTIKDMPLESAIPGLSPNIRLYVRADLAKSQRTPLRVALVPPVEKVAGQ